MSSDEMAVRPARRATSRPGSGDAQSHSTSAGLTMQKSKSISAACVACSARSMRSKRDGMTCEPCPWEKKSRHRRFGNEAA